ncbi:MAG: gliding motility-associated C-terminal domain-containing protein [Prevotella sp.]|nr:gliding motility-associated C-terminal domain-containing protein [Prevotella sp.]
MRIKRFFLHILTALASLPCLAQHIEPTAIYTDEKGNIIETSDNIIGQAPLVVSFHANASEMEGRNPAYEWHFQQEGTDKELMVRYEEDTEYTFITAGTTTVTLIVKYEDGELEADPISVKISESKLTFPNAFSPNEDGFNDTFQAKEYQSLVEFHAYIFNRWGQKLFEWTNPAEGWDGTYHGKPVKEGVYFLLAKAKGADGTEYIIRKDVNLLRGYNKDVNE